jgi:hypothetical protein
MKFSAWRIDWPNHLIGFFSALFGILIAFELEEWRDAKNHQEDARNAFEKTKQEILVNKNALHTSVNTNLQLLDLLESDLFPFINDRLEFIGSAETAININNKVNPIARIVLSDTASTSSVRDPVLINMGSLHHPPLLNSAWESARATGVVNYIEYEKVLAVSLLYNTPRITEELQTIRILLRKADEITNRAALRKLVDELRESHLLIQSELANYDVFVSIVEQME